ncbi:MAG: J domain-containing protein [Armatimonadota bacterium]
MSDDSFDPWRTLGVPVGAGPDEIRHAFRTLARRKHPDVNPKSPRAHEQFVRLRQAYETLMDDEMRARLEREALGADLDLLVVVEDLEQTLLDAYDLLERGDVAGARERYLELAREQPGDPRVLELLEAIHRVEERAPAAEAGERPSPPAPSEPEASRARTHESYRDLWEPEPTEPRWWLAGIGGVVAAACVIGVYLVEAEALVADYAPAEVGLAVLAGFAGMTLVAASGLVGSFDWELGEMIGGAGRGAPLWLYLGAAGMVSPALALIFYLIFTLLEQTRWSWDVAGFFGGVFALAALMGVAHGGAILVTTLVASNAVFVPGLIGWAMGSIFRPGHWWE